MSGLDSYLQLPPPSTTVLFDRAVTDGYVVTRIVVRSSVDQFVRLSKPNGGHIDIARDRGTWLVSMSDTKGPNSYPMRVWARALGDVLDSNIGDEQADYLLDHWSDIEVAMRQPDISDGLAQAARELSPFFGTS